MKLSEAILLGAMVSPQGFLTYFGEDKTTCALGAAAEALGVNVDAHEEMRRAVLLVRYPCLGDSISCPACGVVQGIWRRFRNEEFSLEDVVIHMNDDHRWTRERIADWVATVEPPQDDDAVVAPVRRLANGGVNHDVPRATDIS